MHFCRASGEAILDTQRYAFIMMMIIISSSSGGGGSSRRRRSNSGSSRKRQLVRQMWTFIPGGVFNNMNLGPYGG